MIYDCFLFWREYDVLDIRLHELAPVVDRFVLVESTHTFSGRAKPLYFAENRDRFAGFSDRIIHVVVDDLLGQPGPWEREYYQRNCLLRPLAGCGPEDVILISDVDEIPPAELVAQHAWYPGITAFIPRLYYYFLDCQATIAYSGTRMLPYRFFQQGLRPQRLRQSESLTGVPQQLIHGGGWHFSYLGSARDIADKIGAYAHQEYNLPEYTDLRHILRCMETGQDLFGREDHIRFRFVPIDATYPQYVLENLERFAPYILGDASQPAGGAEAAPAAARSRS
jgi:hypothetical protein